MENQIKDQIKELEEIKNYINELENLLDFQIKEYNKQEEIVLKLEEELEKLKESLSFLEDDILNTKSRIKVNEKHLKEIQEKYE